MCRRDRLIALIMPACLAASLASGLPARADALSEGIEAIQSQQWPDAERLLKEAAKARPTDPVPVEWLTKMYEQTMDPAALAGALAELQRRRHPPAKPGAAPKKPVATAKPPRSTMRLDSSTMPKPASLSVDYDQLPVLTPDSPVLPQPGADAPPAATRTWRQDRLKQLQESMATIQQTLSGLQAKFSTYGQAPSKVQEMTAALQEKLKKQQESAKALKQEMGEEP